MSGSSQAEFLRVYHKLVPEIIRSQVSPILNWCQFSATCLVDEKVRHLSQRLRTLQGRFSGHRCFIMGNGPSLNLMDLELFNQEYVWASNKCYLLFDRISWRPSFYVAIDTRVVPDTAAEINHLVRTLPHTKSFFPVRFREQRILHSGDNVYWYRQVSLNENNLPDDMFTRNASEWVSGARTVTVAALQLAVYLGFNPIYLIGCDTSYSVSSTVRTEGDNPDLLISVEDNDMNHFDPRYFGSGSRYHEPHVDRMIFHYEQAKKVCDSLGVNIFNATVGGNLEVFPRVNYVDLF